jgi:peroxiredoxin Q/BCP
MATKKAAKASSYPKVGAKAPAFSAPGSNGKTVKLSDFKGKKNVVLYFYPKDNTSGCTKEACGFRDAHTKLTRAGLAVIGVSPDSLDSHAKFIVRHDLPFILLADEDKKICKSYGVWQQKTLYGRKYMGVARTTFVIDRQGRIAHVFEKVKAAGHEDEVLAWVRENL